MGGVLPSSNPPFPERRSERKGVSENGERNESIPHEVTQAAGAVHASHLVARGVHNAAHGSVRSTRSHTKGRASNCRKTRSPE